MAASEIETKRLRDGQSITFIDTSLGTDIQSLTSFGF